MSARNGLIATGAFMTRWCWRARRLGCCAFARPLFDQARRYRALSMKHSATPGRLEQHRRLMEAALRRGVSGACAMAEAHIRDTAKTILESLPGYGKPPPRNVCEPHVHTG